MMRTSGRALAAMVLVGLLVMAAPAKGNASSTAVMVTATVAPVIMVTAEGDGRVSIVTNSDRLVLTDARGERPVPRGRRTLDVSGDWCVCQR